MNRSGLKPSNFFPAYSVALVLKAGKAIWHLPCTGLCARHWGFTFEDLQTGAGAWLIEYTGMC